MKVRPDPFTLAIASTAGVASVFPSQSAGLSVATKIAVALVFFFHGARLSRAALRAGLTDWRVHGTTLLATFALFPLLGFALSAPAASLLGAPLGAGFLFLCLVPSTVQSSIAFTALARGNVAAAVCSASLSNVLGMALTPLLVALFGLTSGEGSARSSSAWNIARELLLPFVLGHLLRPLLGEWVDKRRESLRLLDQGAILMVVYGAFSAAMNQNLWTQVPIRALLAVAALTSVLLILALVVTWQASRLLGFERANEITIVFCGAEKSLASGMPMANALFPQAIVGAMVLPLMLYHQLQLLVCAVLARRYAAGPRDGTPFDGSGSPAVSRPGRSTA